MVHVCHLPGCHFGVSLITHSQVRLLLMDDMLVEQLEPDTQTLGPGLRHGESGAYLSLGSLGETVRTLGKVKGIKLRMCWSGFK